MSFVVSGIAAIVTKGNLVVALDHLDFQAFAATKIVGITSAAWMMIVIAILATILLSRTTFGRYVYATGGNTQAARLGGVRVNAVRIATFALSGTAAALAGTLDASRVLSAQASSGQFLTFTVLTGIIVGGTSILGGEGTIGRTVLGCLFVALIANGFNLLGLDPFYQQVTLGVILLLAVGVDAWSRRFEVTAVPIQTHASEPQMHSRRPDRLVVRRPPRARLGDLVRARPAADRRPGAGRRPHRPRRRRRSQPGGWLAPHVHSFEEALYVLEGELLLDLGGRVHRLVAGDFALIPTGLRHALGEHRRRSRSASCRSTRPQRLDPVGAAARHVLRAGAGPRRGWTPTRRGRRSATRPSGWSATTTGRRPQLEALAGRRPGARPRAGRAWTPRSSPTAGSP